jgi:hypothetical protein
MGRARAPSSTFCHATARELCDTRLDNPSSGGLSGHRGQMTRRAQLPKTALDEPRYLIAQQSGQQRVIKDRLMLHPLEQKKKKAEPRGGCSYVAKRPSSVSF